MFETLIMAIVKIYLVLAFLGVCLLIYWLLEKTGFNRWLRGWLWYFGLIDECPDTHRGQR